MLQNKFIRFILIVFHKFEISGTITERDIGILG